MCSGGGGETRQAPNLQPQFDEINRNNAWARGVVDQDIGFRGQVYDQSVPRQQQLYNMATQVAQQQLGAAGDLTGAGRQQMDMYKQTYMPIEQQQALMSQGGLDMSGDNLSALASRLGVDPAQAAQMMQLSRGAMENRARQGMTDARASANSAFAQQSRELMRRGFDPARVSAAAAQLANAQTLAGVGAANQGRAQARGELMQNTMNTANFGRNALGAAGSLYGAGGNLGTSGLANQNVGFMSALPYAQYKSGGVANALGMAGMGNQAALGVGGLMNQQYKTEADVQAAQAQAMGQGLAGLGQLAGTAAGYAAGGPAGGAAGNALTNYFVPKFTF